MPNGKLQFVFFDGLTFKHLYGKVGAQARHFKVVIGFCHDVSDSLFCLAVVIPVLFQPPIVVEDLESQTKASLRGLSWLQSIPVKCLSRQPLPFLNIRW